MVDFCSIPERMYEAAFLPELWVPLLDDIAIATGSGIGAISIYWPEQKGITTSFEVSPARPLWVQSPEETQNWLAEIRSDGYINRGFFQADPYAGDWGEISDLDIRLQNHAERGLGVETGAVLEQFNGEVITFEFARRFGEPRYDDAVMAGLNSLYPAFRQSAFFASRLQFERARASIETLNDFGLPAVALNGKGQILCANALFDSVDAYVSRTASGRIEIRGGDGLRKTFAEALVQSETASVSVAIPAGDFRSAATIQLMPLCRDARSIFALSGTIMVLCPVATTVGVPSFGLVSDLFGLTPAEARLAVALATGLSLRDGAANQGITVGTARSYLIRIFSKTNTSQQSELVSLLKGIVAPGLNTKTAKLS